MLKLWKSGFSLDSGELRSYQDPSNAQFLDDIRRGYVMRERKQLVLETQALVESGMVTRWLSSPELSPEGWVLKEAGGGQTGAATSEKWEVA